MTDKHFQGIIEAFRNKALEQLESSDSWLLLFMDANTSSIFSIYRNDYFMIVDGRYSVSDLIIIQKPSASPEFELFHIEFNYPF